jgi:4-amino-4-deoxy-L-arabinose transferase-like glycosyltransferase
VSRPEAAVHVAPLRRAHLAVILGGLVLVAAVVLHFVATGPLWLDESLSVEIARRPLSGMFTALRHDGSPPLYYLLLHGWIALFGDSTVAVRTLSSVLSLFALPLAWVVGKEVGGRRLAGPMLLVTATTPWALRYATETRMYSLVLVEVLAGIVLLLRARRDPSWPRLLGVTVITAALAYTHYWTFYLLLPVAGWLLWRRQWRLIGAMAAAIVPFAPWLPSFVYQMRYTGTPWAAPADFGIFRTTLMQWGGPGQIGSLLALLMIPLALLGCCALRRPAAGESLGLRPLGVPGVRALAAFAVAPLLVDVVLGSVLHSGYALRYTAVCLPFYLLLLARGLSVLPGDRLRNGTLGVVLVAGLLGGLDTATTSRTQAGEIASALAAAARPGDVVAYCPDQLAPAVHRALAPGLGLRELPYADPAGPALVNWVDYSKRVHALPPATFAQQALTAAGGGHAVWLVTQGGYRVYGNRCSQVEDVLSGSRGAPAIVVGSDGGIFERATLARFPGSD